MPGRCSMQRSTRGEPTAWPWRPRTSTTRPEHQGSRAVAAPRPAAAARVAPAAARRAPRAGGAHRARPCARVLGVPPCRARTGVGRRRTTGETAPRSRRAPAAISLSRAAAGPQPRASPGARGRSRGSGRARARRVPGVAGRSRSQSDSCSGHPQLAADLVVRPPGPAQLPRQAARVVAGPRPPQPVGTAPASSSLSSSVAHVQPGDPRPRPALRPQRPGAAPAACSCASCWAPTSSPGSSRPCARSATRADSLRWSAGPHGAATARRERGPHPTTAGLRLRRLRSRTPAAPTPAERP